MGRMERKTGAHLLLLEVLAAAAMIEVSVETPQKLNLPQAW